MEDCLEAYLADSKEKITIFCDTIDLFISDQALQVKKPQEWLIDYYKEMITVEHPGSFMLQKLRLPRSSYPAINVCTYALSLSAVFWR